MKVAARPNADAVLQAFNFGEYLANSMAQR